MIPSFSEVNETVERMRELRDQTSSEARYIPEKILKVLEAFLPWSGGSTGKVYGDDCDRCDRPDSGCGGCIIHDTREGDEILIKPRR